MLAELTIGQLVAWTAGVIAVIKFALDAINSITPITNFAKKKRAERNDEIRGFAREEIENCSKIANIEKSIETMMTINTSQNELLQSLITKSDCLQKKIDENEIDRMRWEIFDFGDNLRAGNIPSKEQFRHIFDIYTKYESILESLGQENGKIDQEEAFISKKYQQFSDQGKI